MAINNPRDIPGLVGWYSADNMSTHYTNGQSMDYWADLSGAHNHAKTAGTSPLWQSTTGPSGGPAVRFGGAGYFTLPATMFDVSTDVPAGNDMWASATDLTLPATGASIVSANTDNSTFTMESGEPLPTGWSSGKSAWWKFTPSANRTISLDTELSVGQPDTEMAVYTGAAVNTLTNIASDSDSGVANTSRISSLSVTAGTTYYVQVTAYNSSNQVYRLRISSVAEAEVMTKIKSDDTGNRGLWTFGSQGNGSHYPYGGVVYDNFASSSHRNSFTPSLSITSWRRYNVWSASNDWAASLDGTSQTTNSSNTVGFNSTLALGFSAQVTYYILGHHSVVTLFNRKLTGAERTDLATWMDANPSGGTITSFDDAWANAPALPTIHKATGVNTTTWTTEIGEPGGVIFNTAWAKVTPSVTGIYVLDTIGSNYDTVLTVYTGTALNNLVSAGSDDDSGGSGTSKLTLSLTGGTTYYIQVSSKIIGGGNLSFSIMPKPDSRLGAVTSEAITDANPDARLGGVAAETLTGPATAPVRRLGSVTAEVLVPVRFQYIGWGEPVKSPPNWS